VGRGEKGGGGHLRLLGGGGGGGGSEDNEGGQMGRGGRLEAENFVIDRGASFKRDAA